METNSLTRRQLGLRAALALAACAGGSQWLVPAQAQWGERSRVPLRVAVGGKGDLHHLPLTVAERLGYFRDEGLSLDIENYTGAPLAMAAVHSGRADIGCSDYDRLIESQALGFPCRCLVLMGRTPQLVLAASPRYWPKKPLNHQRELRIGVAAPGSSAQFFASLWLLQAGISARQVQFIGVDSGASAIAAFRQGHVQALSHVDPLITLLEQRSEVQILADTRSLKGSADFYGGPMPGACMYASQTFVQQRAREVQAFVNAVVRALKWMQTASPADLARVVPTEYWLDDRAAYLAAFEKGRATLSPDGLMPDDGPATALRAVARLREGQTAPKVNLGLTYSNEWVTQAKLKFQL
ncbi:ABC transporter substrate-binding protein [Diaphorobacter aerolatus]|uniref:ABC transporter substrate-binding protein n=1 Tax=Diaphorobacter aerolatus TaxID=1288495 RepID=A0A7H0GLN0_9BURK|nr:ABC transporter substrate-binding protein [Diaphorobacter aerolatus]QNP49196.1 ABC transporter substrate-binding protein [Diaphorobacter aerolatus]